MQLRLALLASLLLLAAGWGTFIESTPLPEDAAAHAIDSDLGPELGLEMLSTDCTASEKLDAADGFECVSTTTAGDTVVWQVEIGTGGELAVSPLP